MQRNDARVGMRVVFGRPGESAEKSLGEIVKINPTKAKVKLLEERGTYRTHPVGSLWIVPYSFMEAEATDGNKTTLRPAQENRSDDEWIVPYSFMEAEATDGNKTTLRPAQENRSGDEKEYHFTVTANDLEEALDKMSRDAGLYLDENQPD